MSDNKLLCIISGVAFAGLGLTFLLAPISDPDIFWHLKTGQWIWQHRTLPTNDPFTFVFQSHLDPTQQFKLTSYWLAQIFLYGQHQIFGWYGIIGIRFFYVFIITAALMARKKQSNVTLAILTFAFMLALLSEHSLDRPQTFTYCFFALTMYLLERFKHAEKQGGYSVLMIPSIALLWSNMHGGFALFHVLCAWFTIGEVYAALLQKRPLEIIRGPILIILLGVTVSFINPNSTNTLEIYKEMLFGSTSFIYSYISEYQSITDLLTKGKYIFLFYPILFALSCCFYALDGFKKNAINILFFLAFACFSYSNMRYLPLFAIFCLPLSANALGSLGTKAAYGMAFAILAFAVAVSPVKYNSDNLAKLKTLGPIDTRYPIDAVTYLEKNQLSGNILNEYDWGGYLTWELGDESKIFIDTRAMDVSVFKDWVFMSAGRNMNNLMRKYDFELAVLPQIVEGRPNSMIRSLHQDRSWSYIYGSNRSAIFKKK